MSKNLPKKKQLNKFIRFSGIGIQIGVTMYLAAYFGKKLDVYYGNEKKLITLVFVVFGMVASLVSLLAQVKKIQDQDDHE